MYVYVRVCVIIEYSNAFSFYDGRILRFFFSWVELHMIEWRQNCTQNLYESNVCGSTNMNVCVCVCMSKIDECILTVYTYKIPAESKYSIKFISMNWKLQWISLVQIIALVCSFEMGLIIFSICIYFVCAILWKVKERRAERKNTHTKFRFQCMYSKI